jgi:uncharacterized protein YggE
MKVPGIFLFFFWIGQTWASEVLLTGVGRVLSRPDYVEMTLQVQSLCYDTPEQAMQSSDKVASKLVAFLNQNINRNDYYNQVVSAGGFTGPYQDYSQNKVCQNTFQKNHQITFRTKRVADFDKLFNLIQNEISQHFSQQPKSSIESAQTFVNLGLPQPLVSHEKRRTYEKEALSLAMADAQEKLESMPFSKPFRNLRILEVSEVNQAPGPMPFASKALLQTGGGGAPVQFEDIWIEKNLFVRYSFDDVPKN